MPPTDGYDVIVIGSGGAGLRAAICARRGGARVLLVTKGSVLHSGATGSGNYSYCAQFGYFGPGDNAEAYRRDIEASGLGFSDPELSTLLAQNAGSEAEELEAIGMGWNREPDGRFRLATFAGHRFPRAISVGLRTGKVMMATLAREAKRLGVVFLDYTFALEIAMVNSAVAGVILLDLRKGGVLEVASSAVVLATGGGVAMYEFHTNSDELTGDGIALAYHAGADLVDMEFIQSYPTVLVAPPAARSLHFPTGRLLGFGAQLLNARGEEFLARYEPAPIQHATRDQLSRAIALEVLNGGGTPRGGVLVDASGVPPERVRDVHFESYFRDLDLDVHAAPCEVTAAPHYFLGGVRIDSAGRTSLPGLFAAGEVSGGLHGANRLTGTSLPEVLVFGAAAGTAAAAFAAASATPKLAAGAYKVQIDRIAALSTGSSGNSSRVARCAARLRHSLQQNAAILKSATSLRSVLADIEDIERRERPSIRIPSGKLRFNWELMEALELDNMLLLGRLHCQAALLREESRGAHNRLDFPETDDERWRVRLVCRAGKGKADFRQEPLAAVGA